MSEHRSDVEAITDLLEEGRAMHEDRGNRERAIQFSKFAANLRAFLRDYDDLEKKTRPIPIVNGEDLSDLPPELLKELSLAKTDDLEKQIVTIINAAQGVTDIDTVLIHLFRRFKVVQTRRFVQNKLWRMIQKEMLWSVEGKKGLYTTVPQMPVEPDDIIHEEPATDVEDDDEIPF